MKKHLIQTALVTCIMFTVAMAWFLMMGYLFAGPSYGLNLTTSLYAMSIGMALNQTLWFTELAFKKLSYPPRIAGFGLCGLPLLAFCAWFGQWFPTDTPGAWVTFTVIYLVLLAVMTLAYTLYFKKTCGSWEQALARYREQRHS